MADVEQPKPVTDVERRVNDVISDLTGRKVSNGDRGRLRKAVDAADAPLTGRAAGDSALGRISRKG